MHFRRLPADRPVVRRFVEELWLPYHRELERTVEAHALDDSVDLVGEETAFRVEWLEDSSHRLWIAEDPAGDALTGFLAAETARAPSVFDQPPRLLVDDVFVREGDRGTGLAEELLDRAAAWGAEQDCSELMLDVDVDNERAIAFYEKLGFEPYMRRLTAPIEEI